MRQENQEEGDQDQDQDDVEEEVYVALHTATHFPKILLIFNQLPVSTTLGHVTSILPKNFGRRRRE